MSDMEPRVIAFPCRNKIAVLYKNGAGFIHVLEAPFSEQNREIPLPMSPMPQIEELSHSCAFEMHIVHGNLVFGMDPFSLEQLDGLAFGTIDSFPLNV